MATYNFSAVIHRLDRSIYDLNFRDGLRLFTSDPLVKDCHCTLAECLGEMAARTIRTCIVHYPNKDAPQDLHRHARRRWREENDRKDSEISEREKAGTISAPDLSSSSSDHDATARTTNASGSFSFPVELDPKHQALTEAAHKEYAIFDMRDLLHLLVDQYMETYGPRGDLSNEPADEFLDRLLAKEVGTAANISGRNFFDPVSITDSLRFALSKFDKSPRVPVLSAEDEMKVVGLLSVSDFLQFVAYVTELSAPPKSPTDQFVTSTEVASKKQTPLDTWTAGMIKRATRPDKSRKQFELHICFEDERLFDAMKVLYKTGFSAVPIVSRINPRQCVIVFSVRDLLPIFFYYDQFTISGALLNIPIIDYLSTVRQKLTTKTSFPFIHAKANASIGIVISKLLASGIHRLLLTDNEGLLTGILSITDLGRFIAKEISRG